MNLSIDRNRSMPLRDQIVATIRERIESGELASGTRLLSSRDLADELGVNRTTVVQAYRDLLDGGLVESGVGRGTYVRERSRGRVAAPAKTKRASANGVFSWPTWLARARPLPELLLHRDGDAARVPLSRAVGHPELFPVERIKESMDRVFADLGRELLGYPSPAGYEPLRKTLKERLARTGVAVERSELVVVNGSQQGLDLVARLLLADGGAVVTSRPSFSGALDVFRWHRAQLVGVAQDAQGLDGPAFERALASTKPRLVYAIPDRSNPTGLSMSEEGRERLMAAVRAAKVPVLEDDWLAELRRDGEPAPLKARDRDDQVIYLGTYSKVLAPGLRLGWLLVPKALFEPLLALKKVCDLATNLPAQAVLHELLTSGFIDQHVRDLGKNLERRRRAVDAAIDAHFPAEARPLRPHSGMVCWIELPRRADVQRVVEEARKAGVEISAGAPFDPAGAPVSAFRLSYATANERDLEPALKRLGRVLKQVLEGNRGAAVIGPALV